MLLILGRRIQSVFLDNDESGNGSSTPLTPLEIAVPRLRKAEQMERCHVNRIPSRRGAAECRPIAQCNRQEPAIDLGQGTLAEISG